MRPSSCFVYALFLSFTLLLAVSTANAQPTITSISPQTAVPGTPLTIAGTGFGAAQGASTVKFGSVAAVVVNGGWTNTLITVNVPDAPARSANIVVLTGAGSTSPYPFVPTLPTIKIAVTPKVIQPSNGKLPTSMTLGVALPDCDDISGPDLTQGASAPYSLSVTGVGLKLSSQAPVKCRISAALAIDPGAAGPYTVFLNDKADNPVGSGDLTVLDSSAGPIPPGLNPQVDVMWEVMSQNNCEDAFGKRVAQSLYCIQLKIGNNSGHPIQLAGVGFAKTLKTFAALGVSEVMLANSSYASTRAVLLQSQAVSLRNVVANSVQGAGLIMAGFTPFFSASRDMNPKLHYTTLTSIVSGAALQAYNLIFPDPIIAQLKSLDDQSFRDNMVILNNSHFQTVVFVEKQSVTTALQEFNVELQDAAAAATAASKNPKGQDKKQLEATAKVMTGVVKSSDSTITNSTRPAWRPWKGKGDPNPLLVKLALGSVVIVGDQIEYLQRVQIQSAAAPSSNSPLSANPSSLNFSSQNGVTSGAPQSITLTNGGTTPLTGIALQLPGTTDFSQTNTCTGTLAAGDKCNVSVTYNPSIAAGGTGSRKATLQVSFTGSPTPLAIDLTGVASDTVYFSATTLDLGNATAAKPGPPVVPAKPSQMTLTITNFKNVGVTGLAFNFTGAPEFASSGNTCSGGSLNVNSSCTVTIAFTPTAATPVGARTAKMTVQYQVGGPASTDVSLTGTAQ